MSGLRGNLSNMQGFTGNSAGNLIQYGSGGIKGGEE